MATKTRQLADYLVEGGVQDIAVQQNPHIQPGVLYPGISDKQLDGTTALAASTTGPNSSTVASSKYGTVQSDGRMYYYTDIKGSKPIKDPRIGGHFGSQRYLLSSTQLQQDETAPHGVNVYRFEGREWVRGSGSNDTVGGFGLQHDNNGIRYEMSDGAYIEITGYFSDANIQAFQYSTNRHFTWSVDGGSTTTNTTFRTSNNVGPLGGRYVNGAAWQNIGLGATLGIHTLKIATVDQDFQPYAFELIAQDTTSTANKSKIQIPSQNVVSYGKKFTVSGTPHYDPFAFKTDGTTAWTSGNHNGTAWPVGTGSSANIDTATSLGLAAWVSTNYYKPYNGGRVVWWIDSSGTLKCSVNMMPPNARSIANSASLTNGTEKGDDSAGTSSAAVANNTFYPTFTDQAIDHSQAEVAKTFHIREFGNGAANQGAGGTLADASMLANSGTDDIAYVMDDGLTSHSGDDIEKQTPNASCHFLSASGANDGHYFTFIGTGVSTIGRLSNTPTPQTWGQNLPYGTHILRIQGVNDVEETKVTLDGVVLNSSKTYMQYGGVQEIIFHQPKKPPIPEDAVVLVDYMLMADFVAQTAAGEEYISKGTRSISCSRDFLHTGSSNQGMGQQVDGGMGWAAFDIAESGGTWKLPAFSTNFVLRGYQTDTRHNLYLDGVNKDSAATKDNTAAYGSFSYITTSYELGTHTVEHRRVSGNANWSLYDIVTPIHTSSHYQTFETPYLHELVGGDRNMEQTNLVVTPDGKTWDEVTRDTSYIGPSAGWNISSENSYANNNSSIIVFTLFRGGVDGTTAIDEKYASFYTKDFAIAYDRMICLKDGTYLINFGSHENGGNVYLKINGNNVQSLHNSTGATYGSQIVKIKRGDYIQRQGGYINNGDDEWSLWSCIRIGD